MALKADVLQDRFRLEILQAVAEKGLMQLSLKIRWWELRFQEMVEGGWVGGCNYAVTTRLILH